MSQKPNYNQRALCLPVRAIERSGINQSTNYDANQLHLQQLKEKIYLKRSGMAKKKMFHHNNVPAHTSTIVMTKIHKLQFKLLPLASYSLVLAP